ncbi:major facilitator superfamily transporter [Anopheles sinensis]|uniref:Major facilitator superfamily transporter n=1 Tax=Anopheles sinensis TaxID=74873 RepID=A0A084VJG8_ANOSI|nr:major facilitator superfamily transporter [Anopheles sinensis]
MKNLEGLLEKYIPIDFGCKAIGWHYGMARIVGNSRTRSRCQGRKRGRGAGWRNGEDGILTLVRSRVERNLGWKLSGFPTKGGYLRRVPESKANLRYFGSAGRKWYERKGGKDERRKRATRTFIDRTEKCIMHRGAEPRVASSDGDGDNDDAG